MGAYSIGFSLYKSKAALFLIVLLIIIIAAENTNIGIVLFFRQRSYINVLRLINGESNTAALIILSCFKYINAVTAPIDLPQSPRVVI